MRVLLTGIPDRLQGLLQQSLAARHDVVTLVGDDRDLDTCRKFDTCDVVIQGLPESDDPLVALDHASRGTWNLLTTTKAKRYVLLSSMRMFSAYGPGWHIDESWAPRPSTEIDQLAPYLAEVASREISRIRPIECLILRLDEVTFPQVFETGPVRPNWIHIDDAVSAIAGAVNAKPAEPGGNRWSPFHLVSGGTDSHYPAGRASREPLLWDANHRGPGTAPMIVLDPTWPPLPGPIVDLPAPRTIAILGAGGPLGAITTAMLERNHVLRLSDFRALDEIAGLPPQSEGSPLPAPPAAPHSEVQADVTDPSAVRDVVEGMDAVINCTVMRHDPVQAFRVNTLGAYNVMRSAVDAGVSRVVHTGPILTWAPHPAGYNDDRSIDSTVPPRPGDNLYCVSKHLGQEICRIFAERHVIACPTLLFSGFIDPGTSERNGDVPGPFTISWNDSGRAMAAAATVEHLPEPFPLLHILADSPHDRFTNYNARRILNWEPIDRLDHLWQRRPV